MRQLGRHSVRGILLAALAAIGLAGCAANALDSSTAKKLRGLAALYTSLAASHQGAGPKSAKELKDFALSVPPMMLPAEGIDPSDREAVFTSDRDGQPFVILPGVVIRGMTGTAAPVVAHEQTGVGGKRLVVFANAKVEEADDGRLQELLSQPAH
jgi:hypothetical protein